MQYLSQVIFIVHCLLDVPLNAIDLLIRGALGSDLLGDLQLLDFHLLEVSQLVQEAVVCQLFLLHFLLKIRLIELIVVNNFQLNGQIMLHVSVYELFIAWHANGTSSLFGRILLWERACLEQALSTVHSPAKLASKN